MRSTLRADRVGLARAPRIALLAAAAAATSSLSCSETPSATIGITTGEEADAFSRAPAPATLVVEAVDLAGSPRELARTQLPSDAISLGEQPRNDAAALRVTARDATGAVLLRGESLFFQFGALENAAFDVFVQRTGELARLPRPPAVIEAPNVSIALARYVLAASGTTTFLYDLLLLRPLAQAPTLPRPAKSLTTFDSVALAIDDQGATSFDLTNGGVVPLNAPPGGTFAEIAGGATIAAPEGASYIVGGTRASGPSARVLVVSREGAVSFASLATPREGACAAWVEGRGLVVVGGSASGAGAEVLAPGATLAAALPFPADAVKSCGATALDPTHVLVAGGTGAASDQGGVAPARVLDLACTTSCAPAIWPGSAPLVRAQAAALTPDAALLVGDDASGATRAYRASAAGTKEIPLRAPRRGGRLVALPVRGQLAIVGGAAPVEQYLE